MPPSPVVIAFTGWKLSVVRWAWVPTGAPRYSAPSAWAASSISARRWRSASSRSGPSSHGWPAKSTVMMARVRGVIAAATRAGSTLSVSARTSAKTGRPPRYSTTLPLAAKVSAATITSSPGPMPAAKAATCRAAVPEFTATA